MRQTEPQRDAGRLWTEGYRHEKKQRLRRRMALTLRVLHSTKGTIRNNGPGSDDGGKTWTGPAVHSLGEFCDSSVIDERGRRCMHLLRPRCSASNQAHAHRGSWIPNRAAPNPVAWHTFLSVRRATIGQAHAATAANAIPGTPLRLSSALGSGCRGESWLIGQDNSVSRNCGFHSCNKTPQYMHF
jgi:hypothetical protein